MITFISAALKPFALLAILTAFAAVVMAVQRWFPEGPVKRLLLLKLWDD